MAILFGFEFGTFVYTRLRAGTRRGGASETGVACVKSGSLGATRPRLMTESEG